jgi:hypothetical protein
MFRPPPPSHKRRHWLVMFMSILLLLCAPAGTASASTSHRIHELASFAAVGCNTQCGSGSTIGPDGALYVTDGPGGRLLRIDRRSGAIRTVASDLPKQTPAIGTGGPMDVAFRGHTAYVLVSVVGPAVGQPGVVDGLYRVAADGSTHVVADIGAWSVAHPPATDFFIASGVQYALQPYRGGFLVTDGHHNRVLYVTADGRISEVQTFDNSVPTGLDVVGNRVFMAEAGPVPHRPETGRVLSWRGHQAPRLVASGAPLLVDVEVTRRHTVWALSQGEWNHPNLPENAGLPASPNTGGVFRLQHGRLVRIVSGLDRPTSFEIVGDTAYVITLTGKVLQLSLH